MTILLFALTAALYAAACTLYLVFLGTGRKRVGVWASRTLWTAVADHLAFLVVDYVDAGRAPVENIRQTLSVSSLLVVVAFLLVCTRRPVVVLGGFITPVTLLFFLGAGLGRSVAEVPVHVRSALLPFHIGANTLGLVAFTLAFGVAAAYLVQERQLRRKRLGGLFQRLPSLDVLDLWSFRLVSIGFPLLTLGIVSGGLWARQLGAAVPIVTGTQAFAVLAWAVFAGVLLMRVAAGWRGRRAAIGTIFGFGCASIVVAGYLLRGLPGLEAFP